MNPGSGDHYRLLGVARDAKPEEIKAAYRALAKKYHPDINPGNAQAEQLFKLISEAYSVLNDSKERRTYDFTHRSAGATSSWQRAPGGDSSPVSEAAARAAASRHTAGATGTARTQRTGTYATSGVEDDPLDYEEWSRMHYGPTGAERDWYTSQRVKEARAGGFSSFNSEAASRGQNWQYRQTMRARAEAWESQYGHRDAEGPRAMPGESETAHYRRFATSFRESRIRAERLWPLRLLVVGSAVTCLYMLARQVTKPPG